MIVIHATFFLSTCSSGYKLIYSSNDFSRYYEEATEVATTMSGNFGYSE